MYIYIYMYICIVDFMMDLDAWPLRSGQHRSMVVVKRSWPV